MRVRHRHAPRRALATHFTHRCHRRALLNTIRGRTPRRRFHRTAARVHTASTGYQRMRKRGRAVRSAVGGGSAACSEAGCLYDRTHGCRDPRTPRRAITLRDVITTFRNTVREHAGGLNRLNVYPVPDGDTGTNMARTLDAVVAEMETGRPRTTSTPPVDAISARLADGRARQQRRDPQPDPARARVDDEARRRSRSEQGGHRCGRGSQRPPPPAPTRPCSSRSRARSSPSSASPPRRRTGRCGRRGADLVCTAAPGGARRRTRSRSTARPTCCRC